MKRIGILGGTFNPIHISHILIARAAFNELALDRVIFMPSKNPPHKQDLDVASDDDRMNMVRFAIEDEPGFEASGLELNREGLTYTSDTLKILNETYPEAKFYFIIGGDSLASFPHWHEPDQILRRCALVCVGRAITDNSLIRNKIAKIRTMFSTGDFTPEIYFVNAPQSDISSYMIRKYISYDISILGLTKPAVSDYIFKTRLYRSSVYDEFMMKMESLLSPHRFTHVKNVAKTAVKLARTYNADMDKAYIAGLLHDCAKYLDDEQMLQVAEEYNIELEEVEKASLQLVHAKIGAVFAREVYGIEDEDILNAIRYHTTGRPNMSLLEKIIYIADYIEPGRKRDISDPQAARMLELARSFASVDLDQTLKYILKETYDYLVNKTDYAISDMTRKAYEFYKDI
ncbi:MAG: nicotinate-nucleotide adenylyltransferase [Lachnospiraceae bacterium]|nr:nicotinate-nucleotide adenylyltransferase [Lachnospiraceae bacterium]